MTLKVVTLHVDGSVNVLFYKSIGREMPPPVTDFKLWQDFLCQVDCMQHLFGSATHKAWENDADCLLI